MLTTDILLLISLLGFCVAWFWRGLGPRNALLWSLAAGAVVFAALGVLGGRWQAAIGGIVAVSLPACRRHSPAAKHATQSRCALHLRGIIRAVDGAGICAPLYGAGLQPSRAGRPARRWCAGLRADRSQSVGGPVCRRRRAPTIGGAGVVSGRHDRRLHSSTVRDRGGARDHLLGGRRGRVRHALLLPLPSQARRHALLRGCTCARRRATATGHLLQPRPQRLPLAELSADGAPGQQRLRRLLDRSHLRRRSDRVRQRRRHPAPRRRSQEAGRRYRTQRGTEESRIWPPGRSGSKARPIRIASKAASA